MDKNTYVIVLDTETTNSLDDPICYDIGFAVINPYSGRVIETRSYVVADIFLDKEMMSYAFFADKIPQYWEEIKNGKRKLATYHTIRCQLKELCKKYNVTIVAAHNARFDYRSTALSQRYITSSKFRYFLPYGVELWDTLKMSREIFKNDEEYGRFCYDHNYLTNRGQRRYTAEIIYQFLIRDDTFREEHTGLEDVLIEAEIFTYCINRKPDINGKLW